ncbi:hypothetical protein ACQY0O_003413 [Thecaphora frezii]
MATWIYSSAQQRCPKLPRERNKESDQAAFGKTLVRFLKGMHTRTAHSSSSSDDDVISLERTGLRRSTLLLGWHFTVLLNDVKSDGSTQIDAEQGETPTSPLAGALCTTNAAHPQAQVAFL